MDMYCLKMGQLNHSINGYVLLEVGSTRQSFDDRVVPVLLTRNIAVLACYQMQCIENHADGLNSWIST